MRAGPLVKIDTTYIDDSTRASRDEIEWWKLATLSRRFKKRLIASDGFSVNDPDWDMKLTMYGLLSRLFIKSLRRKVLGGMKGTHRLEGSLGRPPFGSTPRMRRDEGGQILIGQDGKMKKKYVADPHKAKHARAGCRRAKVPATPQVSQSGGKEVS